MWANRQTAKQIEFTSLALCNDCLTQQAVKTTTSSWEAGTCHLLATGINLRANKQKITFYPFNNMQTSLES